MLFPTLHSYVNPTRLCTPNISWNYVGLVVKYPGLMSFKYRRNVGSALYQKVIAPNLYVILKEIITKRMTYTQTATKSISPLNAHKHLKSPPVPSSFLLVTQLRVFDFEFKI